MTLLTHNRVILAFPCLLAPASVILIRTALAAVNALEVGMPATAGLLHVKAAQLRFLLNVNVGLRARLVQ